MTVLRNFLIGLTLALVTCGSAWAQATAQMSGTVQDVTGALLPRCGSDRHADRHGIRPDYGFQ